MTASDLEKRLVRANPVVDPDELRLSRAEVTARCREIVAAQTSADDTSQTLRSWDAAVRRRHYRPVAAFATAFVAAVLIVGSVSVVMRDTVGGRPSAGTTVPPVAETEPPAVASGTPAPTESPAASSIDLSGLLGYDATIASTSDGVPIVAATIDRGDGGPAIRLLLCADPRCESSEIVDIDLEDDRWLERLWVAPNGTIYFLTDNPAMESSLHVYEDGQLSALPEMFGWSWLRLLDTAPIAFSGDARPVFVGPTSDEILTVVVCADAVCSDRTEIPIEPTAFLHLTGPLVEGDSIRLVYSVGAPTEPPDRDAGYDGADMMRTTKLVTVDGIDSSPSVANRIVSEGLNQIPLVSGVDSSGMLRVWLFAWQGEQTSYSTIGCDDVGCVEAEASGLGGWALGSELTSDLRPINAVVETIYDPEAYAAYLEELRAIAVAGRDAPAAEPDPLGSNLVVYECVDAACSAARRSTILATQGSLYPDSLRLVVTSDDTTYLLVGIGDGAASREDTGLWLHTFPTGTLQDLAEPHVGIAR